MKNYEIRFYISPAGIIFDEFEPIHLDSLLAYVVADERGLTPPDRNEQPADIKLPLKRSRIKGYDIWHASALFLSSVVAEDTRFHRTRARTERLEYTKGTLNTRSGSYRSWNIPKQVVFVDYVYCYACGKGDRINELLAKIKYIGRKRAHGFGKVTGYKIVEIANDYSLIKDGKAMRWLPSEEGSRMVRTKPPYWHPMDRVMCCEVGDAIKI